MRGLAFRYNFVEEGQATSNIMGVFLGADNLLIDKIETRMVLDTVITEDTSFLITPTRQRPIKFTELTADQQAPLKNFILTKTRGIF